MLLSDAIDHFVATKRRLSPATHRSYHYDLARLSKAFPGRLLSTITALDLETFLASLPSGYAHTLSSRLAAFYRWASAHRLTTTLPPRSPHRPTGHLPWSEADLAAFRRRWPPDSRQRLIFEAALSTGLRRADLARTLWQPPGSPPTCTSKTGAPIYILPPAASYGPPMTALSLGMAFTGWTRAAGVKRTLHGLRKTAAHQAAAAGCTSHELMALFGWRTLRMAEHYTASLDRARLAETGRAKLAK